MAVIALFLAGLQLSASLTLQEGQVPSSSEERYKRETENGLCGIRNSTGGGEDPESTSYGEFPWMIDVRKKENGTSRVRCGGSLIRSDVVLTAAHCVLNVRAEELMVRAGAWDRSQESREEYQERGVERVESHESYNDPPLANDLALLFLDKSLPLTHSIGTVCLPTSGDELDTTKCLATGWGRNHLKKDLQQSKLRKVDLPIVERKECEEKLKKYTEKRKNFTFHDSFICAGGQPLKDTCTGDGGGPLVCPLKGPKGGGRYAQLGIISWGVGCGNELPAVYTSTLHYKNWINEKLGHLPTDS